MATANRRSVYTNSSHRNISYTSPSYRNQSYANIPRAGQNQVYVQGSAARKLQVMPRQQEQTVKKANHAVHRNRDKALHMNVGYVLFLVAAMVMAGMVLTGYLTLQSDITNSIKNVARLESELNSMKLDNDERYSRINSDINLEEVRRVAIQELGMQYAKEGQIIIFNGEDNDYVRQTGDLPD